MMRWTDKDWPAQGMDVDAGLDIVMSQKEFSASLDLNLF